MKVLFKHVYVHMRNYWIPFSEERKNGYPVTRLNVVNNLKELTLLDGLNSKVYNTHSFRKL